MLDERAVESFDITEQSSDSTGAGPLQKFGVDDEQRRDSVVLAGRARPGRIVVEAEIPPEPHQSGRVGHGAQAMGRPKGMVVQPARNASAVSHAPMRGPEGWSITDEIASPMSVPASVEDPSSGQAAR